MRLFRTFGPQLIIWGCLALSAEPRGQRPPISHRPSFDFGKAIRRRFESESAVGTFASLAALVAPEKGGVKPLAALVLKLKEKSDNHLVYDPFESSPDYYEYIDPVYTPGEILIPNETGITFAHS
ncbi:hypothetical protein DdX_18828 [Ditylenchus destructor]|uniref:Uncharacterized protein n=1 Tax=Ditylenchus destructor TaxID=166010 RepID=A0AAD4MIY5_9BILA|nr:hypothetical protein DdX_18828 [Ditylenchus destructor]